MEAVDITGDGECILAIDNARKVLIYTSNSSGMFEIFQTIVLSENTSHLSYAGAITDDKEMIVAGVSK